MERGTCPGLATGKAGRPNPAVSSPLECGAIWIGTGREECDGGEITIDGRCVKESPAILIGAMQVGRMGEESG